MTTLEQQACKVFMALLEHLPDEYTPLSEIRISAHAIPEPGNIDYAKYHKELISANTSRQIHLTTDVRGQYGKTPKAIIAIYSLLGYDSETQEFAAIFNPFAHSLLHQLRLIIPGRLGLVELSSLEIDCSTVIYAPELPPGLLETYKTIRFWQH